MSINRVQIQRGTKGTQTMWVYFGQAKPDAHGATTPQTADQLSSAPPAGFADHVDLPPDSDISATYGPQTQGPGGSLSFQVHVNGAYQVQLDLNLGVDGSLSAPRKSGPAEEEFKIEEVSQKGGGYYALIVPADV